MVVIPRKKRVPVQNVKPPIVQIGGWTEADPSGIKNSATVPAQALTGWPNSVPLTFDIKSPGTVSDLPTTGLRYTRSTVAAHGGAARAPLTKDAIQILACALSSTSLATDRLFGCYVEDATVGFGCGVVSSAGACLAFILTKQAGVWTRTNAASVAAGAVGARVVGQSNTASTTSRVFRSGPLDATLTSLLAAAGNLVVGGPLNFSDSMTTFGMYAGWATGVGGTAGQWTGYAAEVLADVADLVALS